MSVARQTRGAKRLAAKRRCRRAGGALLAVAMIGAAAPAPALAGAVDWLVLLVDASGSIDRTEYRLQHDAYVNVLRDPDIGALLAGARVAIVEFAARPEIIVDWTNDPVAAADAYARHARRIEWPGPAATTGIARALDLAHAMLDDKAGRKVIDISGDGPDNVDWLIAVWAERERARRLAIEINGLAIPTPEAPAIDRYYASNVITGFLEVSRQHEGFERSLRRKMRLEIAGAGDRFALEAAAPAAIAHRARR